MREYYVFSIRWIDIRGPSTRYALQDYQEFCPVTHMEEIESPGFQAYKPTALSVFWQAQDDEVCL